MFNMTWLTQCLRYRWSHSCRNKPWSNPKLIFIFEEWLLCIYFLSVTTGVSLTGFNLLLFIFPVIVKIKTNEKNGNVAENMRRMCVKWQHCLTHKVPPLQCSHRQIIIMTTCTWNENMFCQDKHKNTANPLRLAFEHKSLQWRSGSEWGGELVADTQAADIILWLCSQPQL